MKEFPALQSQLPSRPPTLRIFTREVMGVAFHVAPFISIFPRCAKPSAPWRVFHKIVKRFFLCLQAFAPRLLICAPGNLALSAVFYSPSVRRAFAAPVVGTAFPALALVGLASGHRAHQSDLAVPGSSPSWLQEDLASGAVNAESLRCRFLRLRFSCASPASLSPRASFRFSKGLCLLTSWLALSLVSRPRPRPVRKEEEHEGRAGLRRVGEMRRTRWERKQRASACEDAEGGSSSTISLGCVPLSVSLPSSG
ncbi:hypothetical protein Efla_006072 [Eimeria flavescens]